MTYFKLKHVAAQLDELSNKRSCVETDIDFTCSLSW